MSTSVLSGDRNQCSGCAAFFNYTTAFDGHRRGTFGTLRRPGTRRCMTTAELLLAGWHKDADGYWTAKKQRTRCSKRA
jgi:hypothetical protein